MQIYQKILVTMDCSSVDERVIEHIASIALQNNAALYLLHVVHSHTQDQERALREVAEKALNGHCRSLEEQGIEVHIIIRSGEPEEQILEEVRRQNYDLVAMATHGHSFLGALLFGSVARTLRHKIDIPLLLIKPS